MMRRDFLKKGMLAMGAASVGAVAPKSAFAGETKAPDYVRFCCRGTKI